MSPEPLSTSGRNGVNFSSEYASVRGEVDLRQDGVQDRLVVALLALIEEAVDGCDPGEDPEASDIVHGGMLLMNSVVLHPSWFASSHSIAAAKPEIEEDDLENFATA